MAASWEDVPGLGELMARAYDVREGSLDPPAVAERIAQLAPYIDRLAALVKPRDGETIADVGCGAGSLSLALAQRVEGARVAGVDIAPRAVEAATAAASEFGIEARFREGSAGDIETFAPGASLVLGAFILNLLPEKSPFIEALARTVGPAGRVLVVDAFVGDDNAEGAADGSAPGPLLAASFEAMAAEAGLRVVGRDDLTELVGELHENGVWPWAEVVRLGLRVIAWRLERVS